MIRRRLGAPPDAQESSSDEEDAFSALSSSQKTKATTTPASNKQTAAADDAASSNPTTITERKKPAILPVSTTSSMKRHHGTSGSRKAKMDEILQQMEADTTDASNRRAHRQPYTPERKKGSFVQPGEEHVTTNIFVGNLAPSITEEQMTDLFRQFGDLYSLKIMWPRTPEERARNRHTGFVCFMNREDAEDAMEACDEMDPFNVGRRLMLRWGKSVKMVGRPMQEGAAPGTAATAKAGEDGKSFPDAKRRRLGEASPQGNMPETKRTASEYNPSIHGVDAIRVVVPADPDRARFITTIASFVAKDGSVLEQRLIAKERKSAEFDFLTFNESSQRQREEHVFYKWRVYSFCQGDGFETWRTQPFTMLRDNGKYWIPPPVDRAAALREERAMVEREQMIRQQKAQRRSRMGRKDFVTGRQLEQAKFGRASGGADGGAHMTDNEMKDFNSLTREKLCASREAICSAMAFCFEKSGAAKQIAKLLKELLEEDGPEISVDTRIARLFLLSDILYNSQQPGVRNAFLYRDAIERMAPDVFASLGKHGEGKVGRMTLLKLKTAVGSILSAWTNWSVYNPAFIDELEARFDGREHPRGTDVKDEDSKVAPVEKELPSAESETGDDAVVATTVTAPRGGWTDVTDEPQVDLPVASAVARPPQNLDEVETTPAEADDSDIDGMPLEEGDLDGESLGDDIVLQHSSPSQSTSVLVKNDPDGHDIDGEPFDNDE